MTETAKHTPVPWYTDGMGHPAHRQFGFWSEETGALVAMTWGKGQHESGRYVTDEEQTANAEFIVTAVNHHEELVHALECAAADLGGLLPYADPSGDRVHPGWKTLDEIAALLTKLDRHNADPS